VGGGGRINYELLGGRWLEYFRIRIGLGKDFLIFELRTNHFFFFRAQATYVFFPFIELFGDERLSSLPKDPLLDQRTLFWIILDLSSWREAIDIFGEEVIEEWGPPLNRMGHLYAVAHAR
jgi:hypothetical protein